MKKLKYVLFFIFLYTLPLYYVSATDMIGARSATSSAGDVFLGGNYIEVGISKSGSFGTSMAAPESFKSHALSSYDKKLGLIADADGWDVGNNPTSGDFFLPGSPYEGYEIKYTIDGVNYSYSISERTNYTWNGNTMVDPSVIDESNIEKGLLRAVFTVTTKENIFIIKTILFIWLEND